MQFDAIHNEACASADTFFRRLQPGKARWDKSSSRAPFNSPFTYPYNRWRRAYAIAFNLRYGADVRIQHDHLGRNWLRVTAAIFERRAEFELEQGAGRHCEYAKLIYRSAIDAARDGLVVRRAWAFRLFSEANLCSVQASIQERESKQARPMRRHRRLKRILRNEISIRIHVRQLASYDISNVAKALEDRLARTKHNNGSEAHQLQLRIGSFLSEFIGPRTPVIPRRTSRDTALRVASVMPVQNTPTQIKEYAALILQARATAATAIADAAVQVAKAAQAVATSATANTKRKRKRKRMEKEDKEDKRTKPRRAQ